MKLDGVVKDTIKGFDAFRTYNYSASLGTTIYGTFNFKEGKKLQSIRHMWFAPLLVIVLNLALINIMTPILLMPMANTAEYTRFENALFGTPYEILILILVGTQPSTTTFEAKVTDKDTTATEPKKISLY